MATRIIYFTKQSAFDKLSRINQNVIMSDDPSDEKRVKISVVEEPASDGASSPSVEMGSKDIEKKEEQNAQEVSKKDEKKTPDQSKSTGEGIDRDKMPFWVMFLAFLVGLSLGAGLIGGIFYFKSHVDKLNSLSGTPSPKPVLSLAPAPLESNTASSSASPVSKPDLSQYTVQVLNGSGIKGEAAKVEALLKEAGFTNIKTGNASRYDYEETEVSLKKGVETALMETITKALEGYSIKELTTSSPIYDILITVGSKKG